MSSGPSGTYQKRNGTETKETKLIKIKLQTKLPEKVERLSESKNPKLFPVNFKILNNVLYANLNNIVLILQSMG